MIGATVLQPREGAPLFIGKVSPGSPAGLAGIKAGDRLLAVNGTPVTTAREAARFLRSDTPGQVQLRLWRKGQEYEVRVGREKFSEILFRAGQRIVGAGVIVPTDATQAEIDRMVQFDPNRIVARVFPQHVPLNPDRFACGFELFVLREPEEVMVGGIDDGPASKAGLHWGDVILSVNGVNPRGKTATELEVIFTGSRRQEMRLVVNRLGTVRTIVFQLQKVADLLKRNQLRLVNSTLVPAELAEEDMKWFLQRD